MDADLIVDARKLTKTYRRGRVDVPALRDVSLQLARGQSLAIMGPSGSGKTTFLNILAGLDHPTAGEVYISGQRLDDLSPDQATVFRRRHIGFVFQFFNLLPPMTARDNVALPLLAERLPTAEVEQRTTEALAAAKIAHRADHRPGEMSGGEQQRVAIARGLVMRPQLLVADEPTGNLDSASGNDILKLLREAVDQFGLSLVMVTHSEHAAAMTDRVVTIRDGRLIE